MRLWALATDLRMRRRGGRFRLELARGPLSITGVPLIRIRPSAQVGGTTVLTIGSGTDLGVLPSLDLAAGAEVRVTIGAGCTFERGVRVQAFGGTIAIGDDCEIRDGVTLKATEPDSRLELGRRVRLGRASSIHCHRAVSLGDFASLGERATVVDSFHDVDGSDVWTMEQPVGAAPVRVGRNALILTNAIVVHGAEIGENSVVAAGSLVTEGTYPAGWVLFGSPARPVRPLGSTAERSSDDE